MILDLLWRVHAEGQTIVMVTHDLRSALRGSRILYLRDGKIRGELDLGERRGPAGPAGPDSADGADGGRGPGGGRVGGGGDGPGAGDGHHDAARTAALTAFLAEMGW